MVGYIDVRKLTEVVPCSNGVIWATWMGFVKVTPPSVDFAV